MLAPNSGTQVWQSYYSQGMPRLELPSGEMVERAHREYIVFHLRWEWYLDTFVGGEDYRIAIYGLDLRGMPVRNLVRHKREYPAPGDQTYSLVTGRPLGTDQANQATDDDYELRRARTPVPTKLADVIDHHLSKIYGNKEIIRDGPPELDDWWKDVDGRKTSIDQFMSEQMARLVLVFGQIDIATDHPSVPKGETLTSKADQIRLKLNSVIASLILPQNIPWWRTDRFGQYEEIIVREPSDNASVQYRYWNRELWQLYGDKGEKLGDPTPHPYGEITIQRIFDTKHPKYHHVGKARYDGICEMVREFYNRDSELILSDTTQAHPLLQMAEDFVKEEGTITVGSGWVLPKKRVEGVSGVTYVGADFVDPPKGAAESIRLNKNDLNDAMDRSAHLTKPAGSARVGAGVTGQSGISKRLDAQDGNDMLGKLATMLERAETNLARMALLVLHNGDQARVESAMASVKVVYPREFNLFSAEEFLQAVAEFHGLRDGSGPTPITDTLLLQKAARYLLPGLRDEQYQTVDDELEEYVESKAERSQQAQEGNALMSPGNNQVQQPSQQSEDSELAAQTKSIEAFDKAQEPLPDTFVRHQVA